MWDIFRRFIGKHNALTTLSFGPHYQMAYTVLQMYLDSNMFFDVLAQRSLVQEKALILFSSISNELFKGSRAIWTFQGDKYLDMQLTK